MAGNRQTSSQSEIDDKIKEVKSEYRWVIGIFVIICLAVFGGMFYLICSLSNKVDKLSDQTIRTDQKIQDMSSKRL
jgi:uncharacterized membrane protein